MGTINALGIAKRVKARVLLASTSEIYGDPEVHPQVEEYRGNVNTLGPRSCYDEGKRMAETLMMDYHRQNGVDTRIVRIFNTYGPNMHPEDGRVVSNFIMQALRGESITIYGKGEQTRSFCYVDDLVEGLIRMMNQEETIGPINLGNPDERTILNLAELIISKIGRGDLTYKEMPEDDPTRRKPNIDKANKFLSWSPKMNIEDGLDKTIAYFKTKL
jgi:UDP-glucuronate decarboxylase